MGRYRYPGQDPNCEETSDEENESKPYVRLSFLDGFRDYIAKHKAVKKALNQDTNVRLKDGQIRLIYFRHTRGTRKWRSSKLIDCPRYTFDFNDAPRFQALSYTCAAAYWHNNTSNGISKLEIKFEEETSPHCRVTHDGRIMNIRPNLFNALAVLRNQMRRDLWLWVDSICIEQEDPIERASQVQQMHKIYRAAAQVLVWLGPDLGLRNNVLDFIREFCNIATRLLNPSTLLIDQKYRDAAILDDSWHHILGIENFADKLIDLTIFFKLCRYPTRLWCLQEVALAPEATILGWECMENFYCITYVVDYFEQAGWFVWLDDALDARNLYIEGEPWKALQGVRSTVLRDTIRSTAPFSNLWSLSSHVPPSNITLYFDFTELLCHSRNLSCADPKDKIYALLGLHDQFNISSTQPITTVDYSLSLEVIYTEIQQKILLKTQSLDLLSFIGHSLYQSDPNLPSWVPDLRETPTIYSCTGVMLKLQKFIPSPLLQLDHEQPYVWFEGNKLCCWGCEIDCVTSNYRQQNGARGRNHEILIKSHTASLNALEDLVLSDEYRSPVDTLLNTSLITPSPGIRELNRGTQDTDDNKLDLALYLIITHIRSDGRENDSTEDMIMRCRHMITSVSKWGLRHIELTQAQSALTEIERELLSSDSFISSRETMDKFALQYDTRTTRFVSAANRFGRTRVIAQTAKKWLISAQSPVAEGDCVFMLAGCRTPCILRKIEQRDGYVYRGDCYIYHHQQGFDEEVLRARQDYRVIGIL